MLAAAQALVLATWLPNPPADPNAETISEFFEPTIDNVEHIAATAAAVQSLLLAATTTGVGSYWSSGGVLRSPQLFDRLKIPKSQRLLGAIFLFPSQLPTGYSAEITTSKLRTQRCPPSSWSQRVSLDD